MFQKCILVISFLVILGMVLLTPSNVSASTATNVSPADRALCLPGAELFENPGCLNAGPSARLQQLASLGITFPPEPIFATLVPYDLALIPFTYALAVESEIPLYATLEDVANDHSTNTMPAGRIKYVSLLNRAETDKGRFYQIATTEWVSSEYVKKVGVPNFQGSP